MRYEDVAGRPIRAPKLTFESRNQGGVRLPSQ